ncbi:MAG: hypothetical protein ACM359_00555 [Bacillota bacterium]
MIGIDRFVEVFQTFGKLVNLSNLGIAQASGMRDAITSTHVQMAHAEVSPHLYDDLSTVAVPLTQRMAAITASLDRVPSLARAAAESYLHALADELGESNTATTTTLLETMRVQMVACSGSIAPSGQFYSYFADNFGFTTLPTAAEPKFSEAWITTQVVE